MSVKLAIDRINYFSFSNGMIVIWLATVCFVFLSVRFSNRGWILKFNSASYWLIATLLVAFAAFRPMGAARDDFNYLGIYDGICPTLKCGLWVQGGRDWGWYSILGLFKTWVPGPELMLWLSAFGLLIKLGVVYKLSRQPLLALLLFLGVFYEVLDLTAFRAALASTVFMLAFWCLAEGRTLAGTALSVISGVFHKQGFLAPLILLAPLLKKRVNVFVMLVALPIGLMLLGWFPDIPKLVQDTHLGAIGDFAIKDGLDNFFSRNYQGWRVAPVAYYPLLLLGVWLARDVFSQNKLIYCYAAISIVWAAWFLWGFASLPDAQVRFFDFMILPVVFLAGACRLDWLRVLGVVVVSGIFVLKYNVLHFLLSGSFVS